jgi:hypothetical protein
VQQGPGLWGTRACTIVPSQPPLHVIKKSTWRGENRGERKERALSVSPGYSTGHEELPPACSRMSWMDRWEAWRMRMVVIYTAWVRGRRRHVGGSPACKGTKAV